MNNRVKKVIPNDDYSLTVTFQNNEIKLFDTKQFLEFGAFNELKDLRKFKSARVVDGSVQWCNKVDLSPETLYLLGT